MEAAPISRHLVALSSAESTMPAAYHGPSRCEAATLPIRPVTDRRVVVATYL